MRVGVLGPLEVREGDRRVDIPSARQRALVALLALDAGRVVPVERLIEGLWGDDAPEDARNALRHHVSRLRRAIGPSLVTRGPGYLLAVAPDDVDALRFASLAAEARAGLRSGGGGEVAATLRSALALWRGPPLEEFLDHDWARQEASRLTELHLAAVEDRFDVDLSMGLHADVVEEIRTGVGEHPFRERLWGQLMLALYRSGRQTEALAAYAEARKVLAEELGLDPGPDLAGLERAILAHDPDLAAPPAPAPTRPQQPAAELPAPLTSFIGRHEQVSAIRRLLNERRLITLTGPPGVGKTRLALEAGRLVRQDFPDGVWLVELAPLADPQGIADALVALLRLRPVGRAVDPAVAEGAAPVPTGPLVDQLRGRCGLLILDNCEHLVAGVAGLVEPLLTGCPELTVLATSREVLGVPGEAQWPVPALSLPGPEVDDPRELVGSEAVRLFEDRAVRVLPSFALTAETAPAVAEVCRRLDGLPLAIELAAARVKVLPVAHIAAALGDRFRLLVAGGRTVPPRQQTLRAAVDWSWALLGEDERQLLEQLSVFPGGCSLEAAEWVGERLGLDRFQLLDLLGGLVDKSLLVTGVGADGRPRYRMLETLRAYGIEQSQQRGRSDKVRRRHAELFAAIAETGERGLCGPEHFRWLRILEEELENLRAALQTALAGGDPATAVRVAGALGFFFSSTDRHAEGRNWIEAALAAADDTVPALDRARALTYLGSLTAQLGNPDPAVDHAERGLGLAQASGDPWQTALSTALLAFALETAGRPERVPGLLAEAQATYDAVADPRADWGVAGCQLQAAMGAVRAGDVARVELANRELLTRAGRLRDPVFATWSRLLAGWVAERRGNLESAVDHYRGALDLTRPLGASPYVAFVLALLGRLAMRAGELDRARSLQGEAAAIVDPARSPWFASFIHYSLAATLRLAGEPEAAAALHRQAVAESKTVEADFAREVLFIALVGSPAARSLIALGGLARSSGDIAEAERLLREGLERARRDADAEATALALQELAAVRRA
ncbi:MAG TPA: BTAD domain-containing putative transcriptional regulator [Actinomycetes bacterium]|nr:BTAD domain-containing putative transcriptional regulator [Actinomycetes bacterium]